MLPAGAAAATARRMTQEVAEWQLRNLGRWTVRENLEWSGMQIDLLARVGLRSSALWLETRRTRIQWDGSMAILQVI